MDRKKTMAEMVADPKYVFVPSDIFSEVMYIYKDGKEIGKCHKRYWKAEINKLIKNKKNNKI